jgi:hypothetical protein
MAIAISLHMGCNPIYALSMDMDLLPNAKEKRHFSKDCEADTQPRAAASYTDLSYGKLIDFASAMFRGFATTRCVAASRGQSIFNASGGGFLDVFETRCFERLLQDDDTAPCRDRRPAPAPAHGT